MPSSQPAALVEPRLLDAALGFVHNVIDFERARDALGCRTDTGAQSTPKAWAEDSADPVPLVDAMLDALPVGVVIADASGRIVFGNAQAEALVAHPLRYTARIENYAEWVSFHECGRQVASDDYPLAKILRGESDHEELEVRYRRGTDDNQGHIWLRLIARAIRLPDRTLLGGAVALVDIEKERACREREAVTGARVAHRLNDAFAALQSTVRQTLANADVDACVVDKVMSRMKQLCRAQGDLGFSDAPYVNLRTIVASAVADDRDRRIHVSGDPAWLTTKQAQALTLALHELVRNAHEHGALSVCTGRITLQWSVGPDGRLRLVWWEQDGPAITSPPTRRGFGSRVTSVALERAVGGNVSCNFMPDGVMWTVDFPVEG